MTVIANASNSMIRIQSQVASSSGSLEFLGLNGAIYSQYQFVLEAIFPASNTVTLNLDLGTAGGYLGAGAYSVINSSLNSAGSSVATTGNKDHLFLSNTTDVHSDDLYWAPTGRIYLIGQDNGTACPTLIHGKIGYYNSTARINLDVQGTVNNDNQDIVKAKFSFSTDNITSGTITLYGYIR